MNKYYKLSMTYHLHEDGPYRIKRIVDYYYKYIDYVNEGDLSRDILVVKIDNVEVNDTNPIALTFSVLSYSDEIFYIFENFFDNVLTKIYMNNGQDYENEEEFKKLVSRCINEELAMHSIIKHEKN